MLDTFIIEMLVLQKYIVSLL